MQGFYKINLSKSAFSFNFTGESEEMKWVKSQKEVQTDKGSQFVRSHFFDEF